MAEVFDELLVSLQSKATLRHSSSRRSRAVPSHTASLSTSSSSSSGGATLRRGGLGGAPISRSGSGRTNAGLSLSDGERRPPSQLVWDRNVSVTDLVHEFLGEPTSSKHASTSSSSSSSSSDLPSGWGHADLKSPEPAVPVRPPAFPIRTMKRSKAVAVDPQRLREAERFALEALGTDYDQHVDINFDQPPPADTEGEEWDRLVQTLSALEAHEDAQEEEAKKEKEKDNTATLEQLLAQLEVEDGGDVGKAPDFIPVSFAQQQQRSHSSPALLGPGPPEQQGWPKRVDMNRLNEQLHDGPLLTNDRDALRLELSAPRGSCARCHKHVPAPTLKALDRTYHSECWVCNQCLRPLNTGAFFMLKGVPHCQYCTHKLTLPPCQRCGNPIKEVPVRIGQQNWHRNCLICAQCKKPLIHEPCTDKFGVPLCSACSEPTASFQCAGCAAPIHGEVVVAMDKNWHENCFVCAVCRAPFVNAFYAGPDGRPYCSFHIRPSRSITS